MGEEIKKEIANKKKELAKIESQLLKVRTSVLDDGWQTQRHAKKSRSWDILAEKKRELRWEIEDLQDIESGKWINNFDTSPAYYALFEVKTRNDAILKAWRSSDGEKAFWTIWNTDKIIDDNEVIFWRKILK